MNFKFDYLTFSIIPQFEIYNSSLFVDFIIGFLHFTDHSADFQISKNGGFYDQKYYFHNIYIKTPPADNPKQGYCVEMTGEGYNYYIEFRKNKNPDFTERSFFADILSLQEFSQYKFNLARLDIAIDDNVFNISDSLLDFDTIRRAVLDGEVVTRFRHRTIITNGEILSTVDKSTPFQIYEKGSTNSKFKGSTIYLGCRSNTHCRFYDKLAEMKVHKKPYDENIKHWIRFELQAKADNAMAIITQFVKLSADDFSKYLSEVLLDMVRFVDPNGEQLQSNYYRCPVKSWWSKFLGTVERSKLFHKKPQSNSFVRAVNHVKHNCASDLRALAAVGGLTMICGLIKEGSEEHYKKKHDLIVDDFINYGSFEIDKFKYKGIDKYKLYFADDKEYRSFLVSLRELRDETNLKLMEKAEQEQRNFYINLNKGFTDE